LSLLSTIRLIGCCGAYCKTCKPLIEGFCKGCKLGYDVGERDINKAKCKMKICCFKERKLETCADCPDYTSCPIIQNFHNKKPYKYKRYKQSIEFIRKNGYKQFLKQAKHWKNAYGKLDES
jgi:hypothetical protein